MKKNLRGYHDENTNMETFTLKTIAYDPAYAHKVRQCDNCIDLATKLSLKSLTMNLNRMLEEDIYAEYVSVPLPKSVYEVESLVQLSLKGWTLQHPARITWMNLTRLCLDSVDMKLSFFEDILRSCPMIENLKILNCCPKDASVNFRVSNLYNLKQLAVRVLSASQTFEVNAAPNLESIACSYEPCYYTGYGIRGLVNPIKNLGQLKYQNLKSLTLDYYHCGNKYINLFFTNVASEFPLLEELSLSTDQTLTGFSLSSPSLEKIRLVNMRTLKEAMFDVPNIVHFEFACYHYMTYAEMDSSVYPKLSFVGNPKGWMSEITLGSHPRLQWRTEYGAKWCWPTSS